MNTDSSFFDVNALTIKAINDSVTENLSPQGAGALTVNSPVWKNFAEAISPFRGVDFSGLTSAAYVGAPSIGLTDAGILMPDSFKQLADSMAGISNLNETMRKMVDAAMKMAIPPIVPPQTKMMAEMLASQLAAIDFTQPTEEVEEEASRIVADAKTLIVTASGITAATWKAMSKTDRATFFAEMYRNVLDMAREMAGGPGGVVAGLSILGYVMSMMVLLYVVVSAGVSAMDVEKGDS